jgi:hypothetical protein
MDTRQDLHKNDQAQIGGNSHNYFLEIGSKGLRITNQRHDGGPEHHHGHDEVRVVLGAGVDVLCWEVTFQMTLAQSMTVIVAVVVVDGGCCGLLLLFSTTS